VALVVRHASADAYAPDAWSQELSQDAEAYAPQAWTDHVMPVVNGVWPTKSVSTDAGDEFFSAVYGPTLPAAPDEYAKWEEGPPLTADGRPEAPTHQIGWLAPKGEKFTAATECTPHCLANDYCWYGRCVYRPWPHYNSIRSSCYPDPDQPGLSKLEISVCRKAGAIFSKSDCEGTAPYCKWQNDAPAWYRYVVNEQDLVAYANWKAEQEALKDKLEPNEMAREAMAYAHPGNPVVSSVIKPPEKRWYIDREHIEGRYSEAAWTNQY
jgi:hypothetical protein